MSDFKHPASFVSIATADGPKIVVTAQYNPQHLEITKSVPWQKNPQSNKSPEKGIQLEFTGAESRTMSLELLFDGYEQKKSIAGHVEDLTKMASPISAGSSDENQRRPPLCVVTWGKALANFRCVVESLTTKYTMFSDDGTPLRATCTVKLKEADVLGMKKDDNAGGGGGR